MYVVLLEAMPTLKFSLPQVLEPLIPFESISFLVELILGATNSIWMIGLSQFGVLTIMFSPKK